MKICELIDSPNATETILTTDKNKIYNMYTLAPDGTCTEIDWDYETSKGDALDNYRDHCFRPAYVKEYAKEKNISFTKEFMEYIVIEWVENYLWTHIELNNEVHLTTYWGNPLFIAKHNDIHLTASYPDIHTGEDVELTFNSIADLDTWLDSIYSPRYEYLVEWKDQYDTW